MVYFLPPEYTQLHSLVSSGRVLPSINKADLETILAQRRFIQKTGVSPREMAFAARQILIKELCVQALDLRGLALGGLTLYEPYLQASGFLQPQLDNVQLDMLSELFNLQFLRGQIRNFVIDSSFVSDILFEKMALSDGYILSPKNLKKTVFKSSRLENITCCDVEWADAQFDQTRLQDIKFYEGLIYNASFLNCSIFDGTASKTTFSSCRFNATAVNLKAAHCTFENCSFTGVDMMLSADLLTSKFVNTNISQVQFWADPITPVTGVVIDEKTGYLTPDTQSCDTLPLRRNFGDMAQHQTGALAKLEKSVPFESLFPGLAQAANNTRILPADHPHFKARERGGVVIWLGLTPRPPRRN